LALNNVLCDSVLRFAQYWTSTCGLCETFQLQVSHVATSQTISRRVPSSFIFSGRHVCGTRKGLAVASLYVGFVTLGLYGCCENCSSRSTVNLSRETLNSWVTGLLSQSVLIQGTYKCTGPEVDGSE